MNRLRVLLLFLLAIESQAAAVATLNPQSATLKSAGADCNCPQPITVNNTVTVTVTASTTNAMASLSLEDSSISASNLASDVFATSELSSSAFNQQPSSSVISSASAGSSASLSASQGTVFSASFQLQVVTQGFSGTRDDVQYVSFVGNDAKAAPASSAATFKTGDPGTLIDAIDNANIGNTPTYIESGFSSPLTRGPLGSMSFEVWTWDGDVAILRGRSFCLLSDGNIIVYQIEYPCGTPISLVRICKCPLRRLEDSY